MKIAVCLMCNAKFAISEKSSRTQCFCFGEEFAQDEIFESFEKPTIVNLYQEEFDVYIGRHGKNKNGYFGNLHPIGMCNICKRSHDRADAIESYKVYFLKRVQEDEIFKTHVLALAGKRLGCFCRPHACHGDIIVDWLVKNCQQNLPEISDDIYIVGDIVDHS